MLTAEEEKELRQELLAMDMNLRRKQAFWETPRNLAIVLGAAVAATAAVAGYLGYQTGRNPPPPLPPIVIQLPPQGK